MSYSWNELLTKSSREMLRFVSSETVTITRFDFCGKFPVFEDLANVTSLAVSCVRNILECRCCRGNEHTFRNSGPFIYSATETNCCISDFVSNSYDRSVTVNHSSPIAKRIHLKFSYCLGLLFFVCCEMFLPIEGWTQAIAAWCVLLYGIIHESSSP